MIRKTAIAWAAGLLEGEGSFGKMTDRDVIDRIASVLGGHVFGPLEQQQSHYLPPWQAQLKGPNAAGWMMTIYKFLGTRRRGQVHRALSAWCSMRYVRTSPVVGRAIVEAWDGGCRSKSQLGRSFGVSRETVYRILDEGGRISEVRERLRDEIDIDIAWLAGLFEGEGTVSINGRSLTVRIGMTDDDVIARAAEIMQAKIYVRRRDQTHYQPMWTAQAKGSVAAGVIMTLYPWLGIRRREQARTALAAWRRQGHGVVAGPIADAIVEYRKAGYSQADIMDLFKVGKSTVYRHTKDHVRRMHVTTRGPILPMTTPTP